MKASPDRFTLTRGEDGSYHLRLNAPGWLGYVLFVLFVFAFYCLMRGLFDVLHV